MQFSRFDSPSHQVIIEFALTGDWSPIQINLSLLLRTISELSECSSPDSFGKNIASSSAIPDEFENLADQNSKSSQAELDANENAEQILRVVQRGVLTHNSEVQFSAMCLICHDDSYLDRLKIDWRWRNSIFESGHVDSAFFRDWLQSELVSALNYP